MNTEKVDYTPLLPEGIHPYTIDELKTLTVDRFPESVRRTGLFGSLRVYLEMLESTGFRGFVWVDGSFMCEKPEPEDVDLLLVFDSKTIDAISEAARPVLNGLFDTRTIKSRFKLHVFPVRGEDKEGLDFWTQKFGTQRDERTPKGLAALRINV
jgi:hypothetical protein